MSAAFRCASASRDAGEELIGSASTVRAFLLLEHPGPWGEYALRDTRLPGGFGAELIRRCHEAKVRPLLVRRHGRQPARGARCFVAHVPGRWMETTELARESDVLDLDLVALGRGQSLGLQRHEDPLVLVCTHGRHDACCAERGRPLARALAASHPELIWECSHIGGDRFAANLVVLPDGLYYGRVGPVGGQRLVERHLAGELDLEHLRGRSTYPFPVQAAEWHLRTALGETRLDAVSVVSRTGVGELTDVVLAVGDRRWSLRVRCWPGEPAQLTCRSSGPRRPLRSELISLEELT